MEHEFLITNQFQDFWKPDPKIWIFLVLFSSKLRRKKSVCVLRHTIHPIRYVSV